MITLKQPPSRLSALSCSKCKKQFSHTKLSTFSPCCHKPLVAEYNLSEVIEKDAIDLQDNSMWRYSEFLPVMRKKNIVSLGEGMTPLLKLKNLSSRYGVSDVVLKDESGNPTGSFKARGISVAISKAKEFGINSCIIPTAGNAGGALAAYCAKASIKCTVVMPRKTPEVFKQECELYGADLILIDGLINDCARKVEQLKVEKEYFDISTMKEPFRLEGKKTMGYEIAEQLNWELPDVIIYPAGGGTGLIGIWKAFREMQQMGWISGPLPRMIAIQSENCASIESAVKNPSNWKDDFTPLASVANGLAVPYPFAMDMMLDVLRESNGTTCTISESDIISSIKEIAYSEGLIISPEGAAAWKGIIKLIESGKLHPSDKILLLNTGSGYKYLENIF